MTAPITDKLPIVQEVERVFDIVNKQMFGSRLVTPTITVQLEKKVVFRFTPESYHMLIGSKFAEASIKELEEALLHEMIHISNHTDGVVDCTSNQYHNKRFLSAALEAGMFVARHKTQGWGVTTFEPVNGTEGLLEPKTNQLRKRQRVFSKVNFKEKIVTEAQRRMKIKLEANRERKVCFLKYVCKCKPPHNSIRSGRRPDGKNALDIHCNICDSDFRLEEGQVVKD
jgi:hypothetical protein